MAKLIVVRKLGIGANAGKHRPKLSTDLLAMMAGNALYFACQWGVLVATVKCGTPEMVGQLSLGFAICAPIFLFFQLRLRAASATDAGYEYETPEYVTLRLLCTILAIASVTFVCLHGHFALQTTAAISAVSVAKAIESGSDLFYGFLQNADRVRPIAVSMIARGIFGLAGFLRVLQTTHNLLWALIALCAAWAMVLLTFDLPVAAALVRQTEGRGILIRWKWRSLGKLAWLSFPLGVSAMLMSLAINIPRYFIEHFAGSVEVGLFSALAYLTIASGMIVNSLAEVTVPRFAKLFTTARFQEARRLLLLSLAATVVVGAASIAIAAAFSAPLVTLVYRAQYAKSGSLLIWLMVAAAFANIASIFNYVLLAARRFQLHLACLIALTIGTTGASFVMIPRWGALGAAFASIFGFVVQAVLSAHYVRRFLDRDRVYRQPTGKLITLHPARGAASSV
jgi:O-antigen/teichoic acid export membrane protein